MAGAANIVEIEHTLELSQKRQVHAVRNCFEFLFPCAVVSTAPPRVGCTTGQMHDHNSTAGRRSPLIRDLPALQLIQAQLTGIGRLQQILQLTRRQPGPWNIADYCNFALLHSSIREMLGGFQLPESGFNV